MNINKPLLLKISIALVLALSLWMLWWFLFTGRLAVTSPDNTAIYLVESTEEGVEHNRIGSGEMNHRLRPGEYTVSGQNEAEEIVRKTISIEARQTTEVDLTPQPLSEPEEILHGAAYGIVARGESYRFLDPNLDLLYTLSHGSNQALPLYYELYPVSWVDWIDYDNALVQTDDNMHALILNGEVEDFPYPSGLEATMDGYWSGITSYDMNQNGQLVINMEHQLFYYEDFPSSPEKVYELDSDNVAVNLSSNEQIFVHTEAFAFGHDEATAHNFLIDTSGEFIDTPEWISEGGISFADWSPDNERLLLEIESEIHIYDTLDGTVELLMQHPPQNIDATTWLSESEAIMIFEDAIWIVNIDEMSFHKITNIPNPINHGSAIYIDGDRLLFSTSPTGGFTESGGFYEVSID